MNHMFLDEATNAGENGITYKLIACYEYDWTLKTSNAVKGKKYGPEKKKRTRRWLIKVNGVYTTATDDGEKKDVWMRSFGDFSVKSWFVGYQGAEKGKSFRIIKKLPDKDREALKYAIIVEEL